MQIQIGDDVIHKGYPVGKLTSIRTCLGNGGAHGLIQLHGHADDEPTAIPMRELKRDVRHTEAAL